MVWVTVSSSAVTTSLVVCGVHGEHGVSLGAYTAGCPSTLRQAPVRALLSFLKGDPQRRPFMPIRVGRAATQHL
eukprot:15276260-Heterocapsa_arctica.AAC.1